MNLYHFSNGPADFWVLAATQEEAEKLLPDHALEPINLAPPWPGVAPVYSVSRAEIVALDKPSLVAAFRREQLWI